MFTAFHTPVNEGLLPQCFTYPYKYTPHALCELAAHELQDYLRQQTDWTFEQQGKMFGVLVVQNTEGEVGYLSAYAGSLPKAESSSAFVPAVVDRNEVENQFNDQKAEIKGLQQQLDLLENAPSFLNLKQQLLEQQISFEMELRAKQSEIVKARKERKKQREQGDKTLDKIALDALRDKLNSDSIEQKKALQAWKAKAQQELSLVQNKYSEISNNINELKELINVKSNFYLAAVNARFLFLNSAGESKSLNVVFEDNVPDGAGECPSIKLLQFAFNNAFKALAFAQFWWGVSPANEVRHHGHFYPACRGRCKPILEHMLSGIDVEDNPLSMKLSEAKTLDIIYQDEAIVVINKPADLLSVPGNDIKQSVYTEMKQLFPDATGPLIVHRLDMATSGLMVIALNKDAHKHLQQQFIKRHVGKRYHALLAGYLGSEQGVVDLPLRVDLDDRPRQVVCYDYGKSTVTEWQVIERSEGKTRVHFYPKTGRSHQLRMHSAHVKGLNCPIVGDELYGKPADRLYLHAEWLQFKHPVTGEVMAFQAKAPF